MDPPDRRMSLTGTLALLPGVLPPSWQAASVRIGTDSEQALKRRNSKQVPLGPYPSA